MIAFKEAITTYWPHLSFVLLGAGYLIKSIFDGRSKKIEINHTIYQQNRLVALNRFFNSYATINQMWNMVPVYDVDEHRISAKELDAMIFPLLNEIESSMLELQIYLIETDHKPFKEIFQNMQTINSALSDLYFKRPALHNQIERVNKFHYTLSEYNVKNRELLKEASLLVRKKFGVNR